MKEELNTKNLQLEETIKGLNEEKEELNKQNLTVTEQLAESTKKNNQQESEIQELRGQISNLQEQLKEKEEANQKLAAEAEEMRQKLKVPSLCYLPLSLALLSPLSSHFFRSDIVNSKTLCYRRRGRPCRMHWRRLFRIQRCW